MLVGVRPRAVPSGLASAFRKHVRELGQGHEQRDQTGEAFKAASGPNIVNVIDELAGEAEADLSNPVKIEETRVFPDIDSLRLEKNQDGSYVWKKITDASVVATDLKSSTAVSYSKQDPIGARLYQAATGNWREGLPAV